MPYDPGLREKRAPTPGLNPTPSSSLIHMMASAAGPALPARWQGKRPQVRKGHRFEDRFDKTYLGHDHHRQRLMHRLTAHGVGHVGLQLWLGQPNLH
jgi:hypothetical protein